jgi:hypothetical protein
MASAEQLAAQIRFHLSELGARNAHHEFEHLCREYARRRIASNILPATGPVSAGGDQGRDFETFHSYLQREIGDSAFVGLVSDRPIAFSCTTQSDRIPEKIRSDVAQIVAGGQPVDRIYSMLSNPLPVAQRHQLEDEARDQHGIDLTVIDALALAEGLAEPDMFPIAERYLHLPAELALSTSEAESHPDWYVEGRERWKNTDEAPASIGQLLDLKDYLRFATFNVEARGDLEFWLSKMKPATESGIRELRQRARYEFAVAQVRGARDMRPADEVALLYLDEAVEESDATRLSDAAVLLWYVVGAVAHDATDISADEVIRRNESLRDRVRLLLTEDPYPHAKVLLLQTLGHLAAMPVVDGPSGTPADIPDVAQMFDPDGRFMAPAIDTQQVSVVDAQELMEAWLALAGHLDEAPLFPVADFSRMLSVLAPVLVDLPRWRELTTAIDGAFARSRGKSAAAESARDRAFALMRANRLLDALEEMQQAKVDWWTGETVRGSLLAALLISNLYRQLRMPAAAKQYAVVAAGAAMATGQDDLVDLVGRGLRAAASADHFAGLWCDGSLLSGTSLTADSALLDEGVDFDDEGVATGMFHLTWILLAARDLVPRMSPRIVNVLPEGIEDFLQENFQIDTVASRDAEEWASMCDEQLCGRAYADVGATRVVRFQALGLDWTVESANSHRGFLISSRFLAGAQVLLVELAREDLLFAKNRVDVRIEDGGGAIAEEDRVRSVPENDGRKWVLRPRPPGSATQDELDVELLAMVTIILLDASFAPQAEFDQALERAFERGLRHKMSFGRPYEEVLEGFVSVERYVALPRMDVASPLAPRDAPSSSHDELAWQVGPAPTMSAEDLVDAARARYEKIPPRIPRTLAQLRTEEQFAKVVARLRQRGWLDWHIATAVFNVVANEALEKLRKSGVDIRSPANTEPAREQPEAIVSEEELPRSLFSVERLDEARRLALLAVAQNYGLEARQRTPDFDSLEELLAARYGYWTVDADHPPLFQDADVSDFGVRTGRVFVFLEYECGAAVYGSDGCEPRKAIRGLLDVVGIETSWVRVRNRRLVFHNQLSIRVRDCDEGRHVARVGRLLHFVD